MTLTDEQCRRLVELLDEHGSGDISLWSSERSVACKTRLKSAAFKPITKYANTPSAALLAALDKVANH